MNQLTAVGILGRDATKNTFSNASSVVNFSLAVSDDYKDQSGNWVQRTIWYDCAVFKDMDIKRWVKGSKVLIQGTPRLNEYTDKSGNKSVNIRVVSNYCEMLNSKYVEYQGQQPQQAFTQPQAQPQYSQSVNAPQPEVDDLPF